MTNNCECYEEREVIDYYSLNSDRRLIGICNGTKERDGCSCKGNRTKCDFYPEVRAAAKKESKEYKDKKELEFYRWWIEKHNLSAEATIAFGRWFRDENISNT